MVLFKDVMLKFLLDKKCLTAILPVKWKRGHPRNLNLMRFNYEKEFHQINKLWKLSYEQDRLEVDTFLHNNKPGLQ